MIKLISSIQQLKFHALMDVYSTSLNKGSEAYNLKAEQDFYCYLKDTFFENPSSFCAVLEKDGRYLAALRIEPYRDGLLLTGLETLPEAHGRGYATTLVTGVLTKIAERGAVVIYSHVEKNNVASLRVHQKCGFSVSTDSAVLIDGSFSQNYFTLTRYIEKSRV